MSSKYFENTIYVFLLAFILILSTSIVIAVPSEAAAVRGVITWSNGSTVSGADVNVVCQHNGINTTLNTTSFIDGSYNVHFTQKECGNSDWIWVNAMFDNASGRSNGQTCVVDDCYIPVTLVDVQIPEFGLMGLMLIVLAAVGIIALRKK